LIKDGGLSLAFLVVVYLDQFLAVDPSTKIMRIHKLVIEEETKYGFKLLETLPFEPRMMAMN
jgi:hypothetical protein